jgi:uncharacterized protein YacL (UPF0231 family)
VRQTIDGCPGALLGVTVTVFTNILPPSADSPQTFCSDDNATLQDFVIFGQNIQWYQNSVGGSPLPLSTPLSQGNYYATQTIDGCESGSRLTVFANIITNPTTPAGPAEQGFCISSNPVVADLEAVPMGNWYLTPTGGSPIPTSDPLIDGQTYYNYVINSNGCESGRLEVLVSIGSTPAPTGQSNQAFCEITGFFNNVGNLSANGTQIQWYAAPTGGTPLSLFDLISDGQIYYASQTINNCESENRLAVTVEIINTPPPTTSSFAQAFCLQDNAVIDDFDVSGTAIVWYDANSGGNLLNPSDLLVHNQMYYAEQTVNGCASSSRTGIQALILTTPAPSGDANQEFCILSNATVNDLIPSGLDYIWYGSPSGGGPLASSTPLIDGGLYYASQMISGCESIDRLEVTVSITPNSPTPTGPSAQNVCLDDNPVIGSLIAFGSNIEWFDAPLGGNLLPLSTPLVNGGTYYAEQTINGCESGTRLQVTVTLTPNPATPTGDAMQLFCNGTEPKIQDLQATGSNILWFDQAIGGSQYFPTQTLTNGFTYYAEENNNGCGSSSRLAVTVSFTPAPAAPTGDATQFFCTANNPTVADLTSNGTLIQWYDGLHSSNLLPPSTPLVAGNLYYATQTIGDCESEDRFQVLANVVTNPAAPSGDSPQIFCSINAATISSLQAAGQNIIWYDASTGGNSLAVGEALIDGGMYYASQTVNGCESINRFAVEVTINSTLAPTGISNQSFCAVDNPVILNLDITGAGIQWYAQSSGGSPMNVNQILQDGMTYYASQTLNGCESEDRFEITVTLFETATPTGPQTQEFCATENATIADLEATGNSIEWYATSFGGSPLNVSDALIDGTTYYATQTDNGCISGIRLPVLVNIYNIVPAPSGDASQTFCDTEQATIADLNVAGQNIQWYDAPQGNLIATSTSLENASSYFATQILGSCESEDFLEIVVSILTTPQATVNASANILTANESGFDYQWIDCDSGNPIAGETNQTFTASVSGNYAVTVSNGLCEETSACFEAIVASLAEEKNTLVTVSPNPSNGLFSLTSNTNITFTITDALGRLVRNNISMSGELIIDLSHEEKGVYFLNASGEKLQQSIKIVLH